MEHREQTDFRNFWDPARLLCIYLLFCIFLNRTLKFLVILRRFRWRIWILGLFYCKLLSLPLIYHKEKSFGQDAESLNSIFAGRRSIKFISVSPFLSSHPSFESSIFAYSCYTFFLSHTQIILFHSSFFFPPSPFPSLPSCLCIPHSSGELACLLLRAWLMPRNPDSWCIIAGLWRRAGSRSRSRSCLFWILLLLWSSNEYLTSHTALSAPSSAGWDPAISCCSSLLVLQASGEQRAWKGPEGFLGIEIYTGQANSCIGNWLESNSFVCVWGFFPS